MNGRRGALHRTVSADRVPGHGTERGHVLDRFDFRLPEGEIVERRTLALVRSSIPVLEPNQALPFAQWDGGKEARVEERKKPHSNREGQRDPQPSGKRQTRLPHQHAAAKLEIEPRKAPAADQRLSPGGHGVRQE
jgi:hypothetical protein